ncbi:MAG: hypothetical protein ACTSYB_09000, partial [Candidatus Helarchaeota archaeon]
MSNFTFSLDKLKPEIKIWMDLIVQARKIPEGKIVPSFLEIIYRISSDLNNFLNSTLSNNNIKSMFIGILLIQYLNTKYAIEKVMMFAKGRCRVSPQSPSTLLHQLIKAFENVYSDTSLGKAMAFILQRKFYAAREVILSLKKNDDEISSLLEAIIFSIIKQEFIPLILSDLNSYQTKFAQDSLSIYFSILKNLIYEIQTYHQAQKLSLKYLKNFYANLSQLKG